ncbi:MAG: hypothetical protein KGJ80_11935 [Chloroflexota bacterium]|nr:hypothetical protein [Chloroflexota bacterium]
MSFFSISATLQYPERIRRAASALWVIVLLLNLAEYLLAWLRAIYSWLAAPLQLPPLAFLTPPQELLSMLLTAHLGLLFALIAARAIAFLTPKIVVWNNGLVVETALGKRIIPFDAVRGVRSTELKSSKRFVVWIDAATGLPLQNLIASLLFGRWLSRGLLITSDLPGFDHLVAAVVEHLKRKYDAAGFAAHFSEESPTWLLTMLSNPLATLHEVSAADTFPISRAQAARQMVTVAAALAVPLVIGAIIHLEIPWGAAIIFLVALAELPLASFYLPVVPVEYARVVEFPDALRVYPLTQLPRWLIAAALTLLVVAGVPLLLMILLTIPAIALGCYFVLVLTEDWFAVRRPDALLGLLVTAVFQIVLYELFVALLPR